VKFDAAKAKRFIVMFLLSLSAVMKSQARFRVSVNLTLTLIVHVTLFDVGICFTLNKENSTVWLQIERFWGGKMEAFIYQH